MSNNESKGKNKHQTKVIQIGNDVLQKFEEEMRKTGESPIASAPDPNKPGQQPKFTMESLQIVNDQKGPHIATEEPKVRKKCCRSVKVEEEEVKKEPVPSYSIQNGNDILLPQMLQSDSGKITLVLDLDETLVHSSFIAVPNADFSFQIGVDANCLGIYVCVRPGAEDFLKTLGELYELVLFTASTKFYADLVVDQIDPDKNIKYRLYRESCSDLGGSHVKDLSKIGRDLKKTIIIDNSPMAYILQPYNAIPITSWYDDKNDKELFTIMNVLTKSYRISSVYEIIADM
ncbi:NLI interacting factor-like phosphatase family protein [Trichomonas vaginalis G3]|uniref:NLI interacting factor-like phosphatase family protein n=1 Tax=Trichomonas vaginalis (strain ATCC PRA-98 / G3) TaxID=412133 RepID=A2G0V4_TRIV3|nr:phosphoprotein phosphatase protein [Trichomonas vaginalis G3]EAX89220.1 NLI interacting factor-like phosphatase family protein [Trichomonas vaginalis G3]KAI5527476.1 phosphoprotein phosphatase protein [Trichomonas vaginalis G3]|eukprot:XP_001302150.1 NLI interacting factor-like phosphatase family protein [Trichomonas vaginalis G3]